LGGALAQRLADTTSGSAGRAESRRISLAGGGPGRTGPVESVDEAAEQIDHPHDIDKVVGIDASQRPLTGVTWRRVDPWSADLAASLKNVDAVVHAAIDPDLTSQVSERGERASQLTANVLAACDAAAVKRFVLVSSAMVYGAVSDNTVPLADDGDLLADGTLSVVQDLLDAEAQVEAWRRTTSTAVTVLRPAIVVGESIDTVLTRHFEAPRLLVLKDSTPLWQFAHIDDLATAAQCAIVHGIDGTVPVGCAGWMTQEEVESISGLRRLELPATAVISAAERLHRIGVSPAPAGELDYIRYPWVVGTQRLAEYGWMPLWTNAQVLEALMVQASGRTTIASRRLGRADATSLTAASAAAAVLGAAAIVRARRRKLGG